MAVIDPGPEMHEHVDALLRALGGEEITHQLITHTHIDHSPAAQLVKAKTGAPTYGFGPHGSGKYEKGAKVEATKGATKGGKKGAKKGGIVSIIGFILGAIFHQKSMKKSMRKSMPKKS